MAGWATLSVVGPGSVFAMRVVRNNRVDGVAEARRVYQQALASGRPTIVCANHLTMVDSAFLHWALAPVPEYFLHYRRFSWNVAALEHFDRNLFLKTIVFLAKTVPIDRSDDGQGRAVLEKIRWLVSRGEVLTLFPEGARSRTGRIDPASVTYGVGQILKDLDHPQVLCAYLRGRRQQAMSAIPAWGDTIDLKVELIEPSTQQTGLRAARDLSRQVIGKLKAMEDAWLASHDL
jgi:hypothetical protein